MISWPDTKMRRLILVSFEHIIMTSSNDPKTTSKGWRKTDVVLISWPDTKTRRLIFVSFEHIILTSSNDRKMISKIKEESSLILKKNCKKI